MEANGPQRYPVAGETDIVWVRQMARSKAQELGFGIVDQTRITTAVSELVRNIVKYAVRGMMELEAVRNGTRTGLRIIVKDDGPGIPDLNLAMKEGYSSSGSLGHGLPGAKRLVDEFDIWSEVGKGTRVTITKWR